MNYRFKCRALVTILLGVVCLTLVASAQNQSVPESFNVRSALMIAKPSIKTPHAAAEPLRLVKAMPLPGVQGRIDHLAVDVAGQRLFVCALGNNTLEVVDLSKGERTASLTGFHEPQGVRYLPDSNVIVVANGGDG